MIALSPVGPEAAERLARLHAEAFERPWKRSDFSELLTSPGVAAVAAEDGDAMVGLILIRAVAGESEILTIAVAPDRRRTGLGRALVEAGAALSIGAGAQWLWLEVAIDNPAAIGLYGAAAFEVAGRRPGYYSRGAGLQAIDAVVMRRGLNSTD